MPQLLKENIFFEKHGFEEKKNTFEKHDCKEKNS